MTRRVFAFTLIELLITVAIVAILATIALPMAEVAERRSTEKELKAALREIRSAIDAYKQAADEGRIAKAPDQSGYPPSLATLVLGVTDARSPAGDKLYFLRRIPRNPLVDVSVSPEDGWGKRSFQSPPEAPRPGKDVFDVYVVSEKVGLNGVPYRDW